MAPRYEEPEEEMLEEDQEATRRGSRKKQKFKCGDLSGFTDEQRRLLRRQQREVAKKLAEGPKNEDEEKNFVTDARDVNNKLFEKVAYTREAVLDAENVHTIATKLSKKVDDMIQVPRFEPNKFVSKLKQQLMVQANNGQSYFDWGTLGLEAGVCFNSVPSRVTFLVGPVENGRVPEKRKVRTIRQKKAVEESEAEEEEPEELAKKERKSADQLSQADRNLKQMRSYLIKKSGAAQKVNKLRYDEVKENEPDHKAMAKKQLTEQGNQIDFVRFLVNPKSFTQTIENIFNFSFLVKKGEAKITMRKLASSPLGDSQGSSQGSNSNSNINNPLNLPMSGCFVTVGEGEQDTTKQCVIPFSMKDWRRVCEAYDLEACDIPHRTGTKQTRSSQLSQSQSMTQNDGDDLDGDDE